MTESEIEQRIKAEYKKHRHLDWAKIAAKKISSTIKNESNISKINQYYIDNAH